MMMKKININTSFKTAALFIACIFFAFVLIKFPSLSAEGVKQGLALCANTMIPSLFPFLVVSGFSIHSGVINFLGMKTNKFFKKFFHISGLGGSTFLFSLIGGFPVGCMMVSELYENKRITQNEAQRTALSSVNAGPAFIIGAVGTMMLSSYKAGIIIFSSLTVSSVIIFFLTYFIFDEENETPSLDATPPLSVSNALISAVYSASKSMFSVSAWIILFSCIINILSGTVKSENLMSFLTAVLEVSSGCAEIAEKKSPVILSAVLAWSGLSVHCQIFPYITKIGLKLKHLFCAKITHALLASIVCTSLLKIFPCEISVFSNISSISAKTFYSGAPATAGLILMCVIFILDLDRRKKV